MARRLALSALVALGLAFTVTSLQANGKGQPDILLCEIESGKDGKPFVIGIPLFGKKGDNMTMGQAVQICLDKYNGHPVGVDWSGKGGGK